MSGAIDKSSLAGEKAKLQHALEHAGAVPPPIAAQRNPDDVAVARFALAMMDKMAAQRDKGYGGWDNPATCPTTRLQDLLVDHVYKGDPVDVANFAMMLWNRRESTTPCNSEWPLLYPPNMTKELEDALSYMNFQTGPIAHVFQAAGFPVRRRCEAEQAFVLDRMIRAVLVHGEGWLEAFAADVQKQREIIKEKRAATPADGADQEGDE